VCLCIFCFLNVFCVFPLRLSPSVVWYCWLGILICKNRLPYNLYCVGGDVKHCSLTQFGTGWQPGFPTSFHLVRLVGCGLNRSLCTEVLRSFPSRIQWPVQCVTQFHFHYCWCHLFLLGTFYHRDSFIVIVISLLQPQYAVSRSHAGLIKYVSAKTQSIWPDLAVGSKIQ